MTNIVKDYYSSPFGIHLGWNGEKTIRRRDNGSIILSFTAADTFNLYGSNYNDELDGRVIGSGPNILFGNGGNDVIYGKVGDWLDGGNDNDTFVATEGGYINGGGDTDKLVADYSQLNYGGKGIDFGVLTYRGTYTVLRLDTNASLYTGVPNVSYGFESIETIEVTGTAYDDILRAVATTNTLFGGGGNDTFIGQTGYFSGGTGTDTLIANYSNSSQYPYGVYLGLNGENTVRRRDNSSIILSFDGIETLNVTGTQYGDVFIGGTGNDILDGLGGNDSIQGGAGNDTLFATSGADTLEGGAGNDYLYAVADIQGVTKQLYGNEGADTFLLDLKGSIGLGFNFNTQTLGNFVNAITLPQNGGFDWKRMGIDIGFGIFGAVAGAVPVVGGAAGFLTSVLQMGVNGYLDQNAIQQQIQDQEARASQAVQQYNNGANWGSVTTTGARDTIYINDFQIGLDTIVLPKLTDSTTFYSIGFASSFQGKGGAYISILGNGSVEPAKNVVFIANNYTNIGLTDGAFRDLIADLLQGSVISTFTKTPLTGVSQDSTEILSGSFARDEIRGDGGNDELFGHYGDDVLFGDDGNDTLHGGSNNSQYRSQYESIYGNDGNDFLDGGAGNDSLDGGTGNDFLKGGIGNDTLNGGTGNDTLKGEDGDDVLIAGIGINTVDGGAGTDTLIVDYSQSSYYGIHLGWLGQNSISGRNNEGVVLSFNGVESFQVTGTQYDDVFEGRDYADIFKGGAGNDYLSGAGGNDLLFGDAGNDNLIGGTGNDTLNGGDGDDIIVAGTGQNTVDGGTGTDTLVADYSQLNNGAGVNFDLGQNAISSRLNSQILLSLSNVESFNLTGTQYADILSGRSSNDILNGGAGNDTLKGGDGNDSLIGGDGNDSLNGGNGNDTLDGGAGNDILVAGIGINTVDGGAGTDTLIVDYTQSSYYGIHLGWLGQNAIFGRNNEGVVLSFNGVEKFQVTGTQYDDAFEGLNAADVFKGGAGNDYLSGAGGNDLLVGGTGNDVLIGGTGNDTLTGGTGADNFFFNAVAEGLDIITDFHVLEGDKIKISSSGFGVTSSSQFSFDTNTGTLSFNNQQFATLQGSPTFNVATDIVLV